MSYCLNASSWVPKTANVFKCPFHRFSISCSIIPRYVYKIQKNVGCIYQGNNFISVPTNLSVLLCQFKRYTLYAHYLQNHLLFKTFKVKFGGNRMKIATAIYIYSRYINIYIYILMYLE